MENLKDKEGARNPIMEQHMALVEQLEILPSFLKDSPSIEPYFKGALEQFKELNARMVDLLKDGTFKPDELRDVIMVHADISLKLDIVWFSVIYESERKLNIKATEDLFDY